MHSLSLFARRLLAAALPLGALAAQAVPLAIEGLPADAPLAVVAEHDGDALRVQLTLAPEWHAYARDVGGGEPVTVALAGGAFAAAGPLQLPASDDGKIHGRAELRLPLRRTAPGDSLLATMKLAVCDPLQCLPPMTLRLATPCTVLLVAVDDGERTQRIAAFLRERGFVPTVTTYAAVTAAACDAHDVVIADSPTFGQVRGKKVDVKAFPETASPLVAVGFLGTQLLEHQRITMACGYI